MTSAARIGAARWRRARGPGDQRRHDRPVVTAQTDVAEHDTNTACLSTSSKRVDRTGGAAAGSVRSDTSVPPVGVRAPPGPRLERAAGRSIEAFVASLVGDFARALPSALAADRRRPCENQRRRAALPQRLPLFVVAEVVMCGTTSGNRGRTPFPEDPVRETPSRRSVACESYWRTSCQLVVPGPGTGRTDRASRASPQTLHVICAVVVCPQLRCSTSNGSLPAPSIHSSPH